MLRVWWYLGFPAVPGVIALRALHPDVDYAQPAAHIPPAGVLREVLPRLEEEHHRREPSDADLAALAAGLSVHGRQGLERAREELASPD